MKIKRKTDGVVYSTNPTYDFGTEDVPLDTLPPNQQKMKVWLDRKGGQKVVSRVSDFIGKPEDLSQLRKKIQTLCGTGGTDKDGEILIQGDFRDKIVAFLLQQGYQAKKAGG